MTEESQTPDRIATAKYFDLGFRFAVSILIGLGGGYWLDSKIHTTPLFLIIGLFMGLTSGFLTLYRTVYPVETKKSEKRE